LRAAPDRRAFRFQQGQPVAATLPIIFGALLLFAVAITYAPALHHPFQFDDYNVIVDNPAVHSLSAWRTSMPGIRPLLKLSYALNGSLLNWSLAPQPFGFRLFNLGCHLLNTALVLALLHRWLGGHRHALAIATSGAALFALHPAQTEAVTYICGRSVTLMSTFYLASLYLWVDREGLSARRAISLALFVAALLVKETAWTLPFALLLIELLRGASLRTALLRLWPHGVALLIGAALLIGIDDYRRLLAHSLAIRGLDENLLTQIAGQFYLLTQPLLALRTNIDPDVAVAVAVAGLAVKGAALATLVMAGGWLLLRDARRRWIGFALLWFFLHLLPTNSLLPRNDIANDRQLYLALLGPALLCGRGLIALATARIAMPLVGALALVLAVATWQRNADYRSEIALWQATALRSPAKSRVWNNLGFAYQQNGELEAARAAYRRALALDPTALRASINLQLLEPAPPHPQP
jgi:tetratricopeptide (TPR) repeat protein